MSYTKEKGSAVINCEFDMDLYFPEELSCSLMMAEQSDGEAYGFYTDSKTKANSKLILFGKKVSWEKDSSYPNGYHVWEELINE